MDEQLALLASITSCDVEECRAALARCGGDVEAAAQRLVAAAEALTAGRCGECGQDAAGYYGQGSYGSSFFCKACWRRWDEAGPAELRPEEGMLQRDLGLLEAEALEELGRLLMQRTCAKWRLPLRRTGATFAASAASKRVWQGLAEGAEAALRRRRFQLPAAWAFLAGAEAEVGEEVWQLLTIYEAQVSSQLPRRRRTVPPGCTGLACEAGLGQTEEVDVYIYDYGNLDVVARLRQRPPPAAATAPPAKAAALVYDPGCTLCPIGIGVSGLCVSRFTLYPREDVASAASVSAGDSPEPLLPLAAVLWELLLGGRDLPEALAMLRSLFAGSATMAAGAALLLMQPGHGMVVVEWSRCRLSISAVAAEGVLVHANHCVSELQDESHAGIAKLLAESKQRQAEVEGRYADELVAGKLPLELKQIQSFLSGAVQNDDVLATVVSCPQRRELYVRFRLQVPGMELVEDTVACDFWQCFEA